MPGLLGMIVNAVTGTSPNYGGHSIATSAVLQGVSDAVGPNHAIDWTLDNPTVLRQPVTATLKEADLAEQQAALYKESVANGCRKLRAEADRQKAHAQLAIAHRKYLGVTAQSQAEVVAANTRLASKLHGLREQFAELGHSTDRRDEVATQRIDVITAKYRGL